MAVEQTSDWQVMVVLPPLLQTRILTPGGHTLYSVAVRGRPTTLTYGPTPEDALLALARRHPEAFDTISNIAGTTREK